MSKDKKLSVLIDSQLPDFIAEEHSDFVKFIEKYYQHLESTGQSLDVINNITKYYDIDYYNNSNLKSSTFLSSSLTSSATTIDVISTEGFPNKDGYIQVGTEVIFYKQKTPTSFTGCYRNIRGTTKLGDLYHLNDFQQVDDSSVGTGVSHTSGDIVNNLSNLFLSAFIKNFENQYLAGFPEENLKASANKNLLIKNINKFYQAKGSEYSFQFLFNAAVDTSDQNDVPTLYYPRDYTIKTSLGEWVSKYSLQVSSISGDVTKLVGAKIEENSENNYATAIVDYVLPLGTRDGLSTYELILSESSVVGKFSLSSKTTLTTSLPSSYGQGKKINVYSAVGFPEAPNEIIIGTEKINYESKSLNQFVIAQRSSAITHLSGEAVFSSSSLKGYYDNNGTTEEVSMVTLGYLYDIDTSNSTPYLSVGDKLVVDNAGVIPSIDVPYLPFVNESNINPSVSGNSQLLSDVNANVSAIYEDSEYYYVASSSFPSYTIGPFTLDSPQDQKLLRLIRKSPISTTEIYKTPDSEIGVFVNGVRAYSYKDTEKVIYGPLETIEVTDPGTSYLDAPYVLIEGNATAKAVMSGQYLDSIVITDSGSGYTSDPEITITSGRNAIITATVTADRVTRLNIVDPGEYYSTPPTVVIRDSTGRGRYAEYTANISTEGKIVGFNKINEGKFYSQNTISVEIIPVGRNATATGKVKRWVKNRYTNLQSSLDFNYGYYFNNKDLSLGYGYGCVGNPKELRVALSDNLNSNFTVPGTLQHSKILGFAYDGNPIYGPYGYSSPLNPASSITRMTSSYSLKTSRPGGPSDPLGTFIEDYQYNHTSGSLDQNNGRYCITPEYPYGTYAYFVTIDSSNNPVFPYIIGENYYSLPVELNYTSELDQSKLPKNVTRLKTVNTPTNGSDYFALVEKINPGIIENTEVVSSTNNFAVGSKIYLDDYNEENSSLVQVESVKGKTVSSVQSQQTKIVKIQTTNNCYLYDGDTVTQQTSGAVGTVVGDIFDNKDIVIRTTSGTFNSTNTFSSNRTIENLILNQQSSYSKGSSIYLTNGNQVVIESISSNTLNVGRNPFVNNDPIVFSSSYSNIVAGTIYYVKNASITTFQISATAGGTTITLTATSSPPGIVALSEKARGTVLQSTSKQNFVKVQVEKGTFEVNNNYYIASSVLSNTVGSLITNKISLSKNISIFSLNRNVALVTTSENHGMSLNDQVDIDISPNDTSTTTTYYVRKRIHQKVNLLPPVYTGKIVDTGIGSGRILNASTNYASGGSTTFTNVELIFTDPSKSRDKYGKVVGNATTSVLGSIGDSDNARATVVVFSGRITSVTITNKGKGYQKGDLLTVVGSALNRSATTNNPFVYEVTHSGFAVSETRLYLDSVDNLSNTDYLQINDEIVSITSVGSNYVNVARGQKNTTPVNHYDGAPVTFNEPSYRFNANYVIGTVSADPIVLSYENFVLNVVYNTSQTLSSINHLTRSSFFLDQSTPAKIVSIAEEFSPTYNFEFSKGSSSGPWIRNPIIDIQKFYAYKFDTSSNTLLNSFLDFSPSINNNLITVEQIRSGSPGSANSYVNVKFGYGDRRTSNTYTNKVPLNYVNYFYYDKNNIISSENSYLRLVDDPLQGSKTIVYLTPNKFVYEVDSLPSYDGTGTISYTTTSKTAFGLINSTSVTNSENKYYSLPEIVGGDVYTENKALVEAVWDSDKKQIKEIKLLYSGLNYSNPTLLIKGDGEGFRYDIVKNSNGSIASVSVLNKGKNYTFKPEISVIESNIDVKLYSSSIGTLKTVKIIHNGFGAYNDYSLRPIIKTPYILSLKNYIKGSFLQGEEIEQYNGSTLIASGVVYTNYGNNVVKVSNVKGVFRKNLAVVGKIKKYSFIVNDILVTDLNCDIRSYYDNQGKYLSEKSFLNSDTQKLTDSYFYQDYSYVVKSKTPISKWRDLVKTTTHPAGFNVFAQVDVDSSADSSLSQNTNHESVSIIQLWDSTKNIITVQSTKQLITSNIVRLSDLDISKGKGSVIASSFDSSEIVSYDLKLTPEFNGYFGADGNRQGNKVFTLLLSGSGTPYALPKNENIVISLDGIVQEPGVAYTITDTQITFNKAPLGYRDLEGNSVSFASYREGIDTPPQKFIGKSIKFKDPTLNNQLFRKIKDITSQFDGTTNIFDLYYTDNTPVDLINGENLLVSIDGVVQLAGFTPFAPIDRAYYIRKTVVPNQIVFIEPPRNVNGIQQKFFAYSIGSYERIGIKEDTIDDNYGPFRLYSATNGRSITLDDERNVLVFVDGILQKRIRNYILNNSSILFVEPLKKNQKVNIIHYYGKDIQKSLIGFNFEVDSFLNTYQISLNGKFSFREEDLLTNSNGAKGFVKTFKYNVLVDRTYVTVLSQNPLFDTSTNITVTNTITGAVNTINSSSIVAVQNILEDDGISLLERNAGLQFPKGRRYGKSVDPFVGVGDAIRVHGEDEFRQVLSIPNYAKRIHCDNSSDLASAYFGKIGVTNYNKDGRGEQLEVIPSIENGSVTSLSWNKPDWVSGKINVTGFGYETAPILHFVSQPVRNDSGEVVTSAVGGGASAKVILSSSGDVVDVVLTNGGSGYVTPPKVYVAKQYDIKKSNRKVHVNNIIKTTGTEVLAYAAEDAYLEVKILGQVDESFRIESFLPDAGIFDTDIEITETFIIQIPTGTELNNSTEITKFLISETAVDIVDQVYVCDRIREIQPYIEVPPVAATHFLESHTESGVIDTTLLGITNKYSGNVLGQTFRAFYDITDMDNGYAEVSGLSIYDVTFTYPNLTIEIVDNAYNNNELDTLKVPGSSIPFTYTYGSIHEYMSKLTIAASSTDTVIYLQNTDRFPSFGILLLEDELIFYTNKLSDRIYGISRGYNGTIAKPHLSGSYIRTVVQTL